MAIQRECETWKLSLKKKLACVSVLNIREWKTMTASMHLLNTCFYVFYLLAGPRGVMDQTKTFFHGSQRGNQTEFKHFDENDFILFTTLSIIKM